MPLHVIAGRGDARRGRYVCPEALGDGYQFSRDPNYCQPPEGKHADYLAYLRCGRRARARRAHGDMQVRGRARAQGHSDTRSLALRVCA